MKKEDSSFLYLSILEFYLLNRTTLDSFSTSIAKIDLVFFFIKQCIIAKNIK